MVTITGHLLSLAHTQVSSLHTHYLRHPQHKSIECSCLKEKMLTDVICSTESYKLGHLSIDRSHLSPDSLLRIPVTQVYPLIKESEGRRS